MRFLILAAALGAAVIPATTANAQSWRGGHGYHNRGYQNDVRREQRECRRELRRANSRREYQRELRECRREIALARRGYSRDRWDDGRRGYDRRGYGYRQDRGRYWDGYRWRYRY